MESPVSSSKDFKLMCRSQSFLRTLHLYPIALRSLLLGLLSLMPPPLVCAQAPLFTDDIEPLSTLDQSMTTRDLPSDHPVHFILWSAEVIGGWDTGSAPDVEAWISLAGDVLLKTPVQRNTPRPLWTITLPALTLADFERGPLEVTLFDQDLLRRQVIERFTISPPRLDLINRPIVIRGRSVSALNYRWLVDLPEVSPVDLSSEVYSSDSPPVVIRDLSAQSHERSSTHIMSSAQPEEQPKSSRAHALYQRYLSAMLSGDIIRANQALLKLLVAYPDTSYGRKAKRLFLIRGGGL
jgi:hypothetical protein